MQTKFNVPTYVLCSYTIIGYHIHCVHSGLYMFFHLQMLRHYVSINYPQHKIVFGQRNDDRMENKYVYI